VPALIEEVGHWNEMIAAKFGALSDLLKTAGSSARMEAPIKEFSNFERLEFKGHKNQQRLQPFLNAVDQIAQQIRAQRAKGDDK